MKIDWQRVYSRHMKDCDGYFKTLEKMLNSTRARFDDAEKEIKSLKEMVYLKDRAAMVSEAWVMLFFGIALFLGILYGSFVYRFGKDLKAMERMPDWRTVYDDNARLANQNGIDKTDIGIQKSQNDQLRIALEAQKIKNQEINLVNISLRHRLSKIKMPEPVRSTEDKNTDIQFQFQPPTSGQKNER